MAYTFVYVIFFSYFCALKSIDAEENMPFK